MTLLGWVLRMVASLLVLATLFTAISCSDADSYAQECTCLNYDSTGRVKNNDGAAIATQVGQIIIPQTPSRAEINDEQTTIITAGRQSHSDEAVSDRKPAKNRITGHNRVWSSIGPGWDIHINLNRKSKAQAVSSLDWAMRWERATDCLSLQEPDNMDMFEIDELALEAFWDRVWACYLPYAFGLEDK